MAHTPPSRTKRILRDPKDYRGNYLAGILLAAIIAAALWWHLRRQAQFQEIDSWRETTAMIVSSRIDEQPVFRKSQLASGPPETRLLIEARVRYDHAGTTRETPLVRTFFRKTPLDYEKLLAPGQTVRIKFDPKDPKRISLGPLLPD